MTNEEKRKLIFNKYGGRCAYCGYELQKGWHIDELLPVKNKIENLVESMDSVLAIFDNQRRENLKNSLDNIHNITNDFSELLDSENSKLAKILVPIP